MRPRQATARRVQAGLDEVGSMMMRRRQLDARRK
jgi:hypothetical protein